MSRVPIDKQIERDAPRGQEYYWRVMQELDQSNGETGFTLADVTGQTNVQKGTVNDYMQRLSQAGFLTVVSVEKEGIITRNRYRIAKRSRFAPRVRRDGSVCAPPKRDHMWRTMRMNKQFSAQDLAIWASTDDVGIKLADAKDYLTYLHKAGYLKVVGLTPSKGNIYLLVQNTGPKPPQIQRIKQVWDPNLNQVVWPVKNGVNHEPFVSRARGLG